MTPKEKAKDIYLNMLSWQTDSNIYIKRKIINTTAKQCSLIAVDEMISTLPYTDNNLTLNEYAIHLHRYLKQVKHEIENL